MEQAPVAVPVEVDAGIGPARLLARLAPLLVGSGLLVVLTLVLTAGFRLPFGGPPALVGADLGGTLAPDFRLTDQFGQDVALSDLRGRVVVLTFLYTSCPDVCPLIAGKLGQVHDRLGQRADEVAFVVVTVDPERDTAPRVRQYLEAQRLVNKLTFLTGDHPAVEAVWKAYGIGVATVPLPGSASGGGTYEVLHTDALYLIDRQGRERRLLRSGVAPGDLLRSLEALLGERAQRERRSDTGAADALGAAVWTGAAPALALVPVRRLQRLQAGGPSPLAEGET